MSRVLLLLLLAVMALISHLTDGYAWCQEYWNWDGRRISKDGRRWPAEDGKVITYVNGIFHSVPEWEGITHQLQAIFGHEVCVASLGESELLSMLPLFRIFLHASWYLIVHEDRNGRKVCKRLFSNFEVLTYFRHPKFGLS